MFFYKAKKLPNLVRLGLSISVGLQIQQQP